MSLGMTICFRIVLVAYIIYEILQLDFALFSQLSGEDKKLSGEDAHMDRS